MDFQRKCGCFGDLDGWITHIENEARETCPKLTGKGLLALSIFFSIKFSKCYVKPSELWEKCVKFTILAILRRDFFIFCVYIKVKAFFNQIKTEGKLMQKNKELNLAILPLVINRIFKLFEDP